MELVDLSSKYGEFYAPAFSIRLGKSEQSDLVRDLRLAVSQLEISLSLGMTSHFSFTVTDCFNFEHHAFENDRGQDAIEMLDFGTKLELHMGYGDAKSIPWIMSGVVTTITTSFPETGSPELVISGQDHAFLLTLGRNARTWSKARDSDAVVNVAADNNLDTQVETTKEQHAQIEQNNESDWAFLKKLADRNHYELYVGERGVLHFERPKDTTSEILRLKWGEGLLSFKPEANLAGQITRVEVYGWDRNRKEPIVGVAQAGEESGLKGQSGGQRLKKFVRDSKKQPTLRLRQPVFTQSEADQRAKAALNERAKKFLTGDGETIGLPDLRPDRKVFLDGLGQPFSKKYYLQEVTHKLDSSGYRTRFKVKETGL
ncbi:MAG TPA: hypothetical protein VFD92_22665 [Candidatus Binatia bacterium]|nr:hypothetical protein [Candidatus Binatia bacterium]